jgi:DNA-binding transcriptional LysR family regulator
MKLNALRLFAVVADRRSVTKASVAQHVSQSSISHQLRQLQNELGIELYRVVKDGIELTEVGRIFLKRTKKLLSLFENLGRGLNGGLTERSQTLTVGDGRGTSECVLAGLLARYRKDHPEINALLRTPAARDFLALLRASKPGSKMPVAPVTAPVESRRKIAPGINSFMNLSR